MMEEKIIIDALKDISAVKTGIMNLESHITRLDKRINGTFDTIGRHIDEAPIYRDKIGNLETEVDNIKEEKLNTVKNAQYRIALIAGLPGMILALIKIIEWFSR